MYKKIITAGIILMLNMFSLKDAYADSPFKYKKGEQSFTITIKKKQKYNDLLDNIIKEKECGCDKEKKINNEISSINKGLTEELSSLKKDLEEKNKSNEKIMQENKSLEGKITQLNDNIIELTDMNKYYVAEGKNNIPLLLGLSYYNIQMRKYYRKGYIHGAELSLDVMIGRAILGGGFMFGSSNYYSTGFEKKSVPNPESPAQLSGYASRKAKEDTIAYGGKLSLGCSLSEYLSLSIKGGVLYEKGEKIIETTEKVLKQDGEIVVENNYRDSEKISRYFGVGSLNSKIRIMEWLYLNTEAGFFFDKNDIIGFLLEAGLSFKIR